MHEPTLRHAHLRMAPGTGIDVTIGNTSDIAAAVARLELNVGLIGWGWPACRSALCKTFSH